MQRTYGMGGIKRTFQEFSKEEGDLDSTADSRQLFTKRLTPPPNLNSNKSIPTMIRQFDLIKHQLVDSNVQRHQPSSSSSSSSLGSNSIQLGPLPSSSRSFFDSLPLPPYPLSSKVICDSLLVQLKKALKIFSDKLTKNQLNLILADISSTKVNADSFLASNEKGRYLKCLEIIALAQGYCDGLCNGRPASDYPHLLGGPSPSIVISDSLLRQLYDALATYGNIFTSDQFRIVRVRLSSSPEMAEKFLDMQRMERTIACYEYVALEQRLCDGCCNGILRRE